MKRGIFNLVFVFLFVFLISSPHSLACTGPVGPEVGKCAPNFSLSSMDGKKYELNKLQGKVVLVNFWATWCKPCIVEMPSMQKAYKSLSKNNVEILAISIDTNTKEIEIFQKNDLKQYLDFPVFFDQGKKISSEYGTFQVPETYVIDKNGKITDKVIGIHEWDDSITMNYLKLLAR